MFYYYLLFQLTTEINSFIEKHYGDHNFIHITNKLSCVACRARRVRRDVLSRACCTACATQNVRVFPIPKCTC